MSEILIPEKTRIINQASDYPVVFRDATGAVVTPDAATEFSMQGFGTTKLANVTRALLSRGLQPIQPVYNVTAATAGEITVVAPAAGKDYVVQVKFEIETTNREFVLARYAYEFGRTETFNLLLNSGDTAATVLAKIIQSIKAFNNKVREELISYSLEGGTEEVPTGLNITTVLRGTYLKNFRIEKEVDDDPNIITVFNPTVTDAGTSGIGYGSDIEFREKMQYKNNMPYFYDFKEIPVENALYTQIYWEFEAARRDPKSSVTSDRIRQVLWIQENGANEAYIEAFGDFFDQYADTIFKALVDPAELTGDPLYENATLSYRENISLALFKTNTP